MAALLAMLLLAPATGQAATITSAGPITEISISPTLHCNARYAGDAFYEFYPPGNAFGSCGPIITRDTQFVGFGSFVAVSQSEVLGTGTGTDPFQVITTVCAGTAEECSAGTAPLVTHDVRYVVGQDFYRTDVQVTSRGPSETIGIYQYGDCFLQDSDFGYGYVDTSTNGIYCSRNANNAPPARIEGFVPIHAGSSYYQARYNTVYSRISTSPGQPLPNTCECTISQDNGMALAWTGIILPEGGTIRRSFLTAFSPAGVPPDRAPTVTLTSPPNGSQSVDTTPTYGGAAGDQPGDSPTVTVEVYRGSVIPEGPAVDTLTATRTGASWSVEDTSPLPPGTYTAIARQVDDGGNEGISEPVTFTILAEETPPETTITGGPSGLTGDATPTFTFVADEEGSTFECRVDTAAFAPCTSSHTTAAVGDGSHVFEVRAVDAEGTVDASPATRSFTVDTNPPETTITDGPSGQTNDATPTVTFIADEEGSTFECRVDAGEFGSCTSPFTTPALGDGPHTVQVRATDAAGNTGPAASRSFLVDTIGPTTTIAAGPSGSTRAAQPTFGFTSGEEGSTFECRVDAGEFAPCTSPYTTPPLGEGAHTFEVRATDAAGNTGPVATRSFDRDITAPQTQIAFPPAGDTRSRPVFVFSANEPGSTFECRVDSAAFEPCSSPYLSDAALPDGPHTFEVRATDAAGNVGPAQSRPFVRDATPPDATIASGPSGTVEDPQPTFEFSSSEPGATFECSVDGGKFQPCTSPFTTPTLAAGEHTFAVRARDDAGNASAPVSRSFTVAAPGSSNPNPPSTDTQTPSGTQTPASSAPTTTGSSATSTTPNPTTGDRDGDGIPDARDTCADALDPGQTDRDNDGIGDACENSEASGGPSLGVSVVARIVSGEVFVRRPNSSGLRGGARAAQAAGTPRGFVPLKGAELLPVGTIVHSTRGRLSLTSASGPLANQTQRADFYKGIFTIRQKKTRLPVTDLVVQSANFRQICGTGTGTRAPAAPTAQAAQAAQAGGFAFVQKKRSKRVVSRLWGNGSGAFRTTGRNSAATVRGTKWLTQERCDGTLTHVTSGSVSVRDLRRKKTVIVRAGRSYLARRP